MQLERAVEQSVTAEEEFSSLNSRFRTHSSPPPSRRAVTAESGGIIGESPLTDHSRASHSRRPMCHFSHDLSPGSPSSPPRRETTPVIDVATATAGTISQATCDLSFSDYSNTYVKTTLFEAARFHEESMHTYTHAYTRISIHVCSHPYLQQPFVHFDMIQATISRQHLRVCTYVERRRISRARCVSHAAARIAHALYNRSQIPGEVRRKSGQELREAVRGFWRSDLVWYMQLLFSLR